MIVVAVYFSEDNSQCLCPGKSLIVLVMTFKVSRLSSLERLVQSF